MAVKNLLTPRRIILAVVVAFLLYPCGPALFFDLYVPTLTPNDSLDHYIHRHVSITGKYEKPPYDSEQLGYVKFGDETISFYVLPPSYALLKSLKDGETICVTGNVLGPNVSRPPPFRHTITRSVVQRVP